MRTFCFCALVLQAATVGFAQPDPQALAHDELIRLTNEGQFLRARDLATQLIRQAAEAGSGAGTVYRAGLYQLLAIAQNGLGNHADAQSAAAQGIALLSQPAPAAPEVQISLLVSLAEAHTAQAHFREADRALSQAMTVAKAHLEPDHPRVAAVLDGLGMLLFVQGQTARAERSFRSGLAMLERRLGPDHPHAVAVSLNLASLLVSSGRQSEAVPLLERSRNVFERTRGPNHPDTISAAYHLGVAQLASSPAKAEKVLRAAMSAWLGAHQERHSTTASFLLALAQARFRQGGTDEALLLDAQALDILREVLGPEHPQVVNVMYDRAQLLTAAKRKKEAAALAAEADTIRIRKGYAPPGRHTIDVQALRGR